MSVDWLFAEQASTSQVNIRVHTAAGQEGMIFENYSYGRIR